MRTSSPLARCARAIEILLLTLGVSFHFAIAVLPLSRRRILVTG